MVGSQSQKKEFVVHKNTLCRDSPFFRAACGREWKEGQEKKIRLRDTAPEIFNLYVHWLHKENIDTDLLPDDESEESRFLSLGKMLILANFIGDETLTDKMIDIFLINLEGTTVGIGPDTFNYIWSRTPPNSGIQRLLLDIGAAGLQPHNIGLLATRYPPELTKSLAERFVMDAEKEWPTYEDRCKYHSHKAGEGTCKG